MAQLLRAVTVLTEDLGSVPHDSSHSLQLQFQYPVPTSDLHIYQAHTHMVIYIQAKNSHT